MEMQNAKNKKALDAKKEEIINFEQFDSREKKEHT